jgi:hypothetical protein
MAKFGRITLVVVLFNDLPGSFVGVTRVCQTTVISFPFALLSSALYCLLTSFFLILCSSEGQDLNNSEAFRRVLRKSFNSRLNFMEDAGLEFNFITFVFSRYEGDICSIR